MKLSSGKISRYKYAICLFLGINIIAMLMSACGKKEAAPDTEPYPSFMENEELSTYIDESLLDPLVKSADKEVYIKCGAFSGKGIIYNVTDEKMIIATAAHVLSSGGASEANVKFRDGTEALGKAIYSDKTDAGFVVIDRETLNNTTYEAYEGLHRDRELFDNIEKDSPVFIANPDAGNGLYCDYGILTEKWIYAEYYDNYIMLVKASGSEGLSGSALLSEEGVFLGIVSGMNDEGELAIIPYSVVESEYAELVRNFL